MTQTLKSFLLKLVNNYYQAKAIKETEEITGIKKTSKETNEAYTKGAFKASRPPVTEADVARATAAKRKLQGTVAGGGLLTGAGVVSAVDDDE